MAADDTHSMQAIILAQMEAFKRDDGAAAFAFASPGIRSMFGSAERFMHMVRSGYPQVYRPQSIEFRDVVEFRSAPAQVVHVIGQDGKAVLALYPMERQPDGSWRINGCYLLKSPDAGA